MCYKDEAEGGKEMAKDKIPAGLSRFQKIDRDLKVSESPRKIDSIHQNDSIVATRACAVATKI